ncbi:hypothetical protein B0H13DRAFT_1918927 [Mycena leptocephala]|nr:hypothetical protein B0H13DRAFT_1918927 [Mycena leptocephala]
MQRSLAGDAPIVGIDAVKNSAGARTGTALVIFRTTGYNPAIQPHQFSAGKQLTITENTSPGGVQPPPPPPPMPPTSAPSTRPIFKIGPSTAATFSMTTPPTTIATAANSVSTLSSDGNPGSSIFLSTPFAAGHVHSKLKQSATIPSLPDFTDSAVSGEATFISALGLLTTPPAQPPLPTTAPSSQHATKSGPNIHTIIAAVVILVIVLIVGGLALFLRQQRSSTASRLRRFRLRINHLTSPEAVDGMSIVSRTSTQLWGPTRDISAGNMVVWDKQPFAGNNGDVAMQEGKGTGSAVNGRIPVTPPPSYDGRSFAKFD